MGCLFNHKWNGCKCEKCGKTRNEGHLWSTDFDGFEKVCLICGKSIIDSRPEITVDNLSSFDEQILFDVIQGKCTDYRMSTYSQSEAVRNFNNYENIVAIIRAGGHLAGEAINNKNFKDIDWLKELSESETEYIQEVAALKLANLTDDVNIILSLLLKFPYKRDNLYEKSSMLKYIWDDIYKILRDPYGNEKDRLEAAQRLIEVAKNEPQKILPYWDELKKEIEKPPTSEACRYDEEISYQSHSGIGIPFPEKP